MKIAKGGLSWVVISFIITICFFILTFLIDAEIKNGFLFISFLFLLISIVFLIFFRDPQRKIGENIVAVADGKIREISNQKDEDVGNYIKISTFMNIHNVHVNRMPINGEIKEMMHFSGTRIPAFKKESEKNERVVILIKTKIGMIKIIQIAGTLARRIVPYVKKGDLVNKGEKIGLIRLGSRVDIYLPKEKIKSISVKIKDNVKAGESVIAEIYD